MIRQFRQRGVTLVSRPREPWLNGSPEIADVLVAFAGWMAERESARRSERIKAGLARRKSQGLPIGRARGSKNRPKSKKAAAKAASERQLQEAPQ